MHITYLLSVFSLVIGVPAKLLVDYNAARGDDVKILGLINLEKERYNRTKENTNDLYIKNDKDWAGTKSAHFHRKKGYIRYNSVFPNPFYTSGILTTTLVEQSTIFSKIRPKPVKRILSRTAFR